MHELLLISCRRCVVAEVTVCYRRIFLDFAHLEAEGHLYDVVMVMNLTAAAAAAAAAAGTAEGNARDVARDCRYIYCDVMWVCVCRFRLNRSKSTM